MAIFKIAGGISIFFQEGKFEYSPLRKDPWQVRINRVRVKTYHATVPTLILIPEAKAMESLSTSLQKEDTYPKKVRCKS